MVPRDALIQRLDAVDDSVQLITLIAPAGYGKTTVLAQWASTSQRPLRTVQLDATHNDPRRLLHDLALTLPETGLADDAFLPVRTGDGPSVVEAAVRRLAVALGELRASVVLVLDDLHHLHQRAALDVIMSLAGRLPTGSQVVLAGRRLPDLRLGRIRGQGHLVDFGPNDLAFTVAETAALLSEDGVDLPDEAVQEIVQRSEGWPVGIFLTALAMRGRREGASLAEAIGGGNRYIAAYLKDEVLGLQRAMPLSLVGSRR